MDLSIKLNDTKVNIRVAGLVKTPRGYLFEKNEKGYIFALGGRVMLNESSEKAMVREIMEEIGMKVDKLSLSAMIENFYSTATEKVHEICFVYKIETLFMDKIPFEFVEVPINEINKYDVRPSQIIDILKNGKGPFSHIIVK